MIDHRKMDLAAKAHEATRQFWEGDAALVRRADVLAALASWEEDAMPCDVLSRAAEDGGHGHSLESVTEDLDSLVAGGWARPCLVRGGEWLTYSVRPEMRRRMRREAALVGLATWGRAGKEGEGR